MNHSTRPFFALACLLVTLPLGCGGRSGPGYVPRNVGGGGADEQYGPPPSSESAPMGMATSHDAEMSSAEAPWPQDPGQGQQHRQAASMSAGGRVASAAPAAPFTPLPRLAVGPDALVHNTEQYDHTPDSGFKTVADSPLSTFSVDVDTASYSNVRRFLGYGQRPPIDAVRIEELINYFDYEYGAPRGDDPISISTEVTECPWNRNSRLVRVGLLAREQRAVQTPARNLVFLLDVSGSMNANNKLPLLRAAMKMLVGQLNRRDTVSIVTYAGWSGIALKPTRGDNRAAIFGALDDLSAGGSTNGAEGIELAYELAARSRVRGSINRVILATDGDFNVGTTDRGSLTRLIERERERGVFLTVLGFGMGNLKDGTMESLADSGNGNYAYIDTAREAQKVLVDEVHSTLRTVAKDTKIQVEFNPAKVSSYRLIGYENRRLQDRDFNDDDKDAGDMGDGHRVTALYEIVSRDRHGAEVDPLKYQRTRTPSEAAGSDELMTVKVRYKEPEGRRSRLLSTVVPDGGGSFARASGDLRFAGSVAAFGMLLRESKYVGGLDYGDVRRMAAAAVGRDPHGYRREFVELVAAARDARPHASAVD